MNVATRTTVLALGEHRGQPRIYIEGRWLIAAGFVPGGCFTVAYARQQIILELSPTGRTISGKRANAVIDLNCSEILEAFEAGTIRRVMVRGEIGRIVITASYLALRQSQRHLSTSAVSLFAGGGLLCQAAAMAGFQTVAAIEIDSDYADIFQANHGGRMYQCPVEETPWQELAALAPSACWRWAFHASRTPGSVAWIGEDKVSVSKNCLLKPMNWGTWCTGH